jgi:hypothetical protein
MLALPAFALPPWKPKFEELFVKAGPPSLQEAFADNVIGRCKVCHVDGEGTHWFDGQQIYTYTIGSDDWQARIAASKWKNSAGFAETAKGHIGLQDHGAQVSFRNIKIRELP